VARRWGPRRRSCSESSRALGRAFALTLLGELPTSASTLTADAACAQTFNDPPDPSFRTWIEIPEPTSGAPQAPAPGDAITGDLAEARVRVRARSWNTVFTEIQFWLYYPFNGPGRFYVDAGALWSQHVQMDECGRHYSDWEHVSVLFQAGLPVAVYLSRHDANVWIVRKDFGFPWDRGVHPVIYAGKFSHAHYTTVGTQAYGRVLHFSAFDVYLEDYTGAGDVIQTHDPATYWFASSAIAGVDPSDPEPDWLQFPGVRGCSRTSTWTTARVSRT
jgi:hypothetical protein